MVGLLLAVILFAKRMSEMLIVTKVLPDHDDHHGKVLPHVVKPNHDCPQVSIYTIEGPLFFGAAQTFEQSILSSINYRPNVLILRMSKVPYIDTTGEEYFRNIVKDFKSQGGTLFVTGVNAELKKILDQNGLTKEIGEANFFARTGEAINRAIGCVNRGVCLGCKHFAFRECTDLSSTKIS
ncbi:SulP family sulfate permease OS=Ureibacillus acetophenoni OX=614649 GN=SAMN05877842_10438 PE=3 SV=1 [Ureibacillus acetophenoni]